MTLAHPLPVERVSVRAPVDAGPDEWPRSLAPVRHMCEHGMLLGQATVLVGENGVGKSTIVEAIALAYGLSPEGGSTGAFHRTRPSESPLHEDLVLSRGAGASRWGYFIRAESMHGLFTYLEQHPGAIPERFHELSHGQSFLELVDRKLEGTGLFVLDEPEAGLSFQSQLTVVAALLELLERPGAQLLVATHSPVIAALPGAQILQLDDDGIAEVAWDDLETVAHHRSFVDDPERYLRFLT